MELLLKTIWVFLFCAIQAHSFTREARRDAHVRSISLSLVNDDSKTNEISRRDACLAAIGISTAGSLIGSDNAYADDDLGYKPAKRPFAYRVDSTQPPTLIPIGNAQKEMKILTEIGKGLGTDKEAIVDESVNLNNILNKAVFGSIDAISSLAGGKQAIGASGRGSASFVCLGLPKVAKSDDYNLAKNLITTILQPRVNLDTALGLAFCPLSAQPALDSFHSSGSIETLVSALVEKGISQSLINEYIPLFELAKAKSVKLLALSPEEEDINTARAKGLQYVGLERRSTYVFDSDGFIKLSQEPKYRVYADRSLLKDYDPLNSQDSPGLFFSERILVHETAAGIAAKYAMERPDSMVIVLAPTPDLRFLQGINGRIPRLCSVLQPEINKVNDNAVTTILLNPSAKDTLSKTNYLRLEVGTGPETLDYQSKVSDYLWFSFMPKVNMIPRLMNER